MTVYINSTQTATSTPYDNSTSGLIATDVQAAIDESRISNPVNFISITSATAIASSTDTTIGGLTYTNSSGIAIKVVVATNTDITINSTGGVLSYSIYLNGAQVANTLRKTAGDQGALAGAARVTASTACKVIIPNGQTLDVRASVSTGNVSIAAGCLYLTKCGDF